MPIRQTIKITRPNTSVNFYPMSETEHDHVTKTYHVTGKRTGISIDISSNKLVKTLVYEFDSTNSQKEFLNDSTLESYFNQRDLYYLNNGVTMSVNSEDV